MTSPKHDGADGGPSPGACADDGAPLLEGPAYQSGPPAHDGASIEVLPGRVCGVAPERAIDWAEWVARVKVATIAIDGELAHSHVGWTYTREPPREDMVFDVVSVPAVAPMVATVGSLTFHGAPLGPGTGSADVYAEGKPVFRVLRDAVLCPAATPLPHGGGVVMPMGPPPTVFVNGFPLARAGDAVIEPLGGPNPIMMGALTVFAGPPAPPSPSVSPQGRPAGDDQSALERGLEWLDQQFEIEGVSLGLDVHAGATEGEASLGGAADLDDAVVGGEVRVEGGGTLLRFEGELRLEISIFGEIYRPLDQRFGVDVGQWRGRADLILDPVQRRPSGSGEFEFELWNESEGEVDR